METSHNQRPCGNVGPGCWKEMRFYRNVGEWCFEIGFGHSGQLCSVSRFLRSVGTLNLEGSPLLWQFLLRMLSQVLDKGQAHHHRG